LSVCSLEFLVALILLSSILFRLPGARPRQAVLATCSAGFLYSQIPNLTSWIVVAVFLLSGYGCARLLRRRPSRALFTAYLVVLITAFAFLKKYDFLSLVLPQHIFAHPVGIVGLSYMLFRQIHFIIDAMQEQIEHFSLWTYLNYQLNPFTLLAGPIQRYQPFRESWAGLTPVLGDRHEILSAYLRVLIGMIKVAGVSFVFQTVHGSLVAQFEGAGSAAGSGWAALVKFVLMMYCYLFYMYFNFSGYCDIVIAGASLVGIRLPENFNWPFLSRNLLEYWSRWHITLGLWIRDYLFTPIYKAGVQRWPRRASMVAVAGYFVAFSVAGVWHGSTWNFFVYGLLHGAGVSAAKLWENAIVRRSGRPGLRRYLQSSFIRWAAIVGTFHYACFTLFFFAFDLDRGGRIFRTLLHALTHHY
jgi:D-alanyl-lipoteichoic acid acyltransferase DltB (MBOAT superfamily)